MNTRVIAAAFSLLLAGCPGGPDTRLLPDIDLSAARRLESEGRTADALVEMARLVQVLNDSQRTDVRAQVAWGRILESLHRMKFREALAQATPEIRRQCASLAPWDFPSGYAFLGAGASHHWTQVLSQGVEPALAAEAAGSIARFLAEKLDDRTLRRGKLEPESEISESLYRRYLAEAAADYACLALSRMSPRTPDAIQRAAALLQKHGKELRELSLAPGVQPGVAAWWGERAVAADAASLAVRLDRADTILQSTERRQSCERDANGLLKAAIEQVNKANDLLSRRADEQAVLESLEQALRNFVTARECLVEPTALQKRTLDVMQIAADALRSIAFKN